MAPRYCPNCGRPGLSTATFCASCGAALATHPASVAGSPLASYGAPSPRFAPFVAGSAEAARTSAASRAADESALSNVFTAAIIALVSSALSVLVLLDPSLTSVLVSSSGGSGYSVSIGAVYLLAIVACVGLVIALLELWLFRKAFQSLAVESPEFSTPATLVLLALIGLAGIFLLGIGLIAALYQWIGCSGSGQPLVGTCVNLGELAGLALGLLAMGIVALIGFIGMLIGIWRLGSRYGNGLFKVGAILLFFPILNLVGLILIAVAARGSRRKLSSGPFVYGFGGS